jgi:hypothetical protein
LPLSWALQLQLQIARMLLWSCSQPLSQG